jgi:hypothetical protein
MGGRIEIGNLPQNGHGSPGTMAPDDLTPRCGLHKLFCHRFAGRHALLASLSALLAAGHVTALQALGGTVLARLCAQPAHRARERSLVLHQRYACPARLQARQAVLLAVRAITTHEAFSACTQALVAGLDAVLLQCRVKRRLGRCRWACACRHQQERRTEESKDRFHERKTPYGCGNENRTDTAGVGCDGHQVAANRDNVIKCVKKTVAAMLTIGPRWPSRCHY